jgi:hypothetical protein
MYPGEPSSSPYPSAPVIGSLQERKTDVVAGSRVPPQANEHWMVAPPEGLPGLQSSGFQNCDLWLKLPEL